MTDEALSEVGGRQGISTSQRLDRRFRHPQYTRTTPLRFAALASTVILGAPVLLGCDTNDQADPDASAAAGDETADSHAAFLGNLAERCGDAFAGGLTLAQPDDVMLTGTEELVVHFRDCEPDEVRIPFHVEVEGDGSWDRSRTWYVMQRNGRLELRHDHRLDDGSEDERTWYGGFTETDGTATRQDFVSPERTEAAGAPVGWRIEIEPEARYTYGTTLDGEYDWRIDFDLSEPIAEPPPPWGHETPPSREPGPP